MRSGLPEQIPVVVSAEDRVFSDAAGQAPGGQTFGALTQRELAVLRMVADGRSTHEIARALSYSERTIKNAIHDLVTRLQLRNRSHAVAYAVRAGLI
jgi:DNA-binding NarL/FixJ family response regulator